MNLVLSADKVKLKGPSPTVVKWAKTLRTKRAETMQKGGVRMLLLAMKPHVSERLFAGMGCVDKRHVLAFAHGVAIHMLSCPDASWWIEHREKLPYHNIGESVKACAAHYARTKPFK